MASDSIVVVIGEDGWEHFDDVVCFRPANTNLGIRITPDARLEYLDKQCCWKNVRGVVWRAQSQRDTAVGNSILHMIAASQVACVNPAISLLIGSDRIASHHILRKAGLPVIPSNFIFGVNAYSYFFEPELPAVLKVGNWHMGFGKAKAESTAAWLDAVDMAAVTEDYVGIEPFVDYVSDLRVLVVGDNVFGIQRKAAQWKSNVNPIELNMVEVPDELVRLSTLAATALGVQVVGMDWLQHQSGKWFAIEANVVPGLVVGNLDLRQDVIKLLSN